jgi:hypothetical protein
VSALKLYHELTIRTVLFIFHLFPSKTLLTIKLLITFGKIVLLLGKESNQSNNAQCGKLWQIELTIGKILLLLGNDPIHCMKRQSCCSTPSSREPASMTSTDLVELVLDRDEHRKK